MLHYSALLVLLSYASATKYCCIPDQWEGQIWLVEGIVPGGKPTVVKGGVAISYDYTNGKLAEILNITVQGAPQVHQKIIIDYKKNVMYMIIEAQKSCKKTPPPPLSRCIPDSAVETGDITFGSGNNTLEARSFLVNTPTQQLTAHVSVTRDGCVPVTEVVYGSQKGVPLMMVLGFVNIVPGIKDPSIFVPPSYCDQVEKVKVDTHDRPQKFGFFL